MAEFTTGDGTQIFYKDWGVGQRIRVQSWVAAVVRRLGRADALFCITDIE